MSERERRALGAITLAVGMAVALAPAVPADAAVVICQKKTKIKLRVDECKNKETRVEPAELGVSAAGGPYGDGSGGGRITGTRRGDAGPGTDGALFVTLADRTSMF